MAVEKLTLTKAVAGLFIIFYVLVPITRIAYHYKYPELAGKPILCSGCIEGNPQQTSTLEQRGKIECRFTCIQKEAKRNI